MTNSLRTQIIPHGRVRLSLRQLSVGSDEPRSVPLLLLHALGSCTPAGLPGELKDRWEGPVFGLDFTGHGESTCPVGGGYSCELLMADVDTALRRIGQAVLLGAGLGGYVALLAAGAAPSRAAGVIVTGGPGLAGGGVRPGSECIVAPPVSWDGSTPDPFALVELATDVRPPNYAASFVRNFLAAGSQLRPSTVHVCTAARPPWLAAVVEEFGVQTSTLAEALSAYASG